MSFSQATLDCRQGTEICNFGLPSPLDVLNYLQWSLVLFSRPCLCNLARKSPQDVKSSGGENCVKACHVSASHSSCSKPLSPNFCQTVCTRSENTSEQPLTNIRNTSEPHPNQVRTCEVVYFLAYQEGTLPLIYGHPTTTTSLSLSLVVCILLLCCEFILKSS